MHELLNELRRMTVDILENLDTLSADELYAFVEQREKLVNRIRIIGPTAEDRDRYRELVGTLLKADPLIVTKMEELKAHAGNELQKLKLANQQRNRYEAEQGSYDGYFIDQKK